MRFLSTVAKNEYKPGFFSRNPGLVFGGILTGIIGYVYRGSRQKKNFDRIQNDIADRAVISPYEAYELRSANAVTYKDFANLLNVLPKHFPSGRASFQQYDQVLGQVLQSSCPTGIVNGCHLERVLLNLEQDAEKMSDVEEMTTAFSMAVKGTADERLLCLFGIFAQEQEISRENMEKLVSFLLNSFQIPSEKRVVAIPELKYPFQQYQEATATELVSKAIEARIAAEKMAPEASKSFSLEEFMALLKSKQICIWGECFASNSKKRMRN